MNQTGTRKIILSREELYARVWSVPRLQLAREFGVSDVALGRMCRRRNIPCPPPGYWAQYRAGRQPPRPLLPLPQGKISRPALFTVSATLGPGQAPRPSAKPTPNVFSLDHLLASVAEWERRDRVQRYLEACEQQWRREGVLTPPRHTWLAWARHEAARMPPGLAREWPACADEPNLGNGTTAGV